MKIVRTVSGDVAPEECGITLCHEHLNMNLSPYRNGDPDILFLNEDVAAEELRIAAGYGLRTAVDASNTEMGRNPLALRRIAEASGVQVVACGGYYHQPSFPPTIATSTVEELAEAMARSVREGIDGTDVRAGALGEIGTSHGGVTPDEEKVLRAAGLAQRLCGAAVITHTPEGVDAERQLDLLLEGGADPGRVLIGHLDCIADHALHRRIAERGAFVGLDRVGMLRFMAQQPRVEMVLALLEAGLVDHIILSSDVGRFSLLHGAGELGYSRVLAGFLPLLRSRGVDEATLHRILVDNPARLLAFEE